MKVRFLRQKNLGMMKELKKQDQDILAHPNLDVDYRNGIHEVKIHSKGRKHLNRSRRS